MGGKGTAEKPSQHPPTGVPHPTSAQGPPKTGVSSFFLTALQTVPALCLYGGDILSSSGLWIVPLGTKLPAETPKLEHDVCLPLTRTSLAHGGSG